MAHLILRRVFLIYYLTIFISITVLGQCSPDDSNIVYKHDF
jgi:hypothetical protein